MSSSDLKKIQETLNDLQVVTEAKGHLDHPEDAIFIGGSSYAKTALNAIVNCSQSPNLVTIKWDGYPALIFGRGSNGKFAIMDKHMFNKKDMAGRNVYSPAMFRNYDLQRGVDRSELHSIIQRIWQGLSEQDKGYGYYWGDLLFSQPLKDQNGLYKFQANPNGITYTVDANSEIGQLLKNKVAGIAVHQYLEPNSASTDDAVSLNGSIGKLKNDGNVAIVPSAMPNPPKLKLNDGQVTRCDNAINTYGPAVDQLLVAPAGTKSVLNSNLFTVFINRKVVSGNLSNLVRDFLQFVKTRPMSDQIREKVMLHLSLNKQGLAGAFLIWSEMYKLKMSLVKQLDKASQSSPVKGYLQSGIQTQEGFVCNNFKFVDRLGFSRQNLAAKN
jgi:hypothetical protein